MENKRPTFVTVICIIGFIGIPLTFIVVLFNLISSVDMALYELAMPLWYSVFSIPWVIFLFVAIIFIWKMRKVGLIAYTGLAVIQYILGFVSGFVTITTLALEIIAIGLLWTQFKKMSWGYNLNEDSLVQNSEVSSVNVGTSEINSVSATV